MKLAYLCLQATQQGQASYSHVHEIIAGLRRRGWNVRLHEPTYVTSNPSAIARLLQFVLIQVRMCAGARPDVVYIRSHFAAWIAALWYKLVRVPVVQEINGPHEDLFTAWPATRRFAWLFISLSRMQMRWAVAVVAVTPQLAAWAREEGATGIIRVIANGANTTLFCPSATTSLALPDRYAIFFGALSPWQGIDTLLAAAADIRWPAHVTLVVVGDGIERARVEAASANERVVYLGRQPQGVLAGIVAKSLCGLIPKNDVAGHSKTGLCPLKLFEILACGVPVVASDFPGMRELVLNNSCGLIVAPSDAVALAQAVADLAGAPEAVAAMGRRARLLAERDHAWDARAGDTDRLVSTLGFRGSASGA